MVVCHHCHRTGHYASECLQEYNIQTMTMEEKLGLLPELLVLTDSLDIQHAESEPKVERGLEPEEV